MGGNDGQPLPLPLFPLPLLSLLLPLLLLRKLGFEQPPINGPSDSAHTLQPPFWRHPPPRFVSEQQRTSCFSLGSAHRAASEQRPARPHSTLRRARGASGGDGGADGGDGTQILWPPTRPVVAPGRLFQKIRSEDPTGSPARRYHWKQPSIQLASLVRARFHLMPFASATRSHSSAFATSLHPTGH